MEVWGGSQLTSSGVELAGLDVWVYSKPYGQAQRGGDVYYVSSCASGRISRLLLSDVSGHGKSVASTAADLRTLMRRFVNRLDQEEFVLCVTVFEDSHPVCPVGSTFGFARLLQSPPGSSKI